jgi:iron(III) transport system substrate-binding protein
MIGSTRRTRRLVVAATALALLATACGNGDTTDPGTDPAPDPTQDATTPAEDDDADGPLVVYSGRNEELVGEVFDRFTEATGIEVSVRYGDTAELAVTILEEGDRSPADVYFGQDAGALGALESNGRFATLSSDVLDLVDPVYRSSGDKWIGVTGRVRVLAYSTERVSADELPDSIFDITDEQYRGRVGYAPTNGSFQAFVTAMRVSEGEDVARQWMEDLLSIDPQVYQNNSSQLEAIARGEIDFAITNHYYLYRFLAEDPNFPVDNHYLPGDIGGLVNVAGVGIVDTTSRPSAAAQLVAFLLSEETQTYFGQVTDALEFPLRSGVDSPELPSLASLNPPQVDLTRLEDLQGTLALLEDVGAFE